MRRRLLHIGWLLTLALLAAACNDRPSATGTVSLAVICGHHANAPAPAVSSGTVCEALLTSTSTYGAVSIIVADGSPFIAADFDIAPPDRALSAAKRTALAEAQAAQLADTLAGAKAVSPEVDLLAAIQLGARSLKKATGERHLLIMDSGLSTKGYIDFTEHLFRASAPAVIGQLADHKALPDLTQIQIDWVGLGDVCDPQEALTPGDLHALQELWRQILSAAGAAGVTFHPDLPGAVSHASADLPYVTPVPISKDQSLITDLHTPLILGQDKILFLANRAVFADQTAAVATLQPVVGYLGSQPHMRIVLAGTTATAGSRESCRALGLARAQAVRQTLIDMGLDPGQIADAVGLGYDHRYHLPDMDSDGRLNATAAANRSVIIALADSEMGHYFLTDSH